MFLEVLHRFLRRLIVLAFSRQVLGYKLPHGAMPGLSI
ncbi:hypothetical protein DSBG_3155 [Desulfosporosinus sp. BG]|nr:hypothetical protein DSBG_3155 [Desulfosporosinus sp. BG]